MVKSRLPLVAVASVLCATTASAGPGDWIGEAGNPAYSAHAEGTGIVTQPSVRWRVPTGGFLGSDQVLPFDVDGDAVDDLVTVVGGRLRCQALSGQVLWQTPRNGIDGLAGVGDFDGDGALEIVALRSSVPSAVYVVDAAGGGVEMEHIFYYEDNSTTPVHISPLNARSVGAADVDADGKLELFVKPDTDHPILYAFGHDDALGWIIDWQRDIKAIGYANRTDLLLADVTGNGSLEVVVPMFRDILLLDAATGTVGPRIRDVFNSHNFGAWSAIDVNNDGASEIFAVGDEIYDRAISLIDLNAAIPIVWQHHFVPPTEHAIIHRSGTLTDLDGDGALEAIVSIFNDDDQDLSGPTGTPGDYDGVNLPERWATVVYDLATGATRAFIADRVFEGIVQVAPGDAQRRIVVSDAAETGAALPALSTLRALQFTVGAGGADLIDTGWSVQDAALARVVESNFDSPWRQAPIEAEISLDADATPGDELLVLRDLDGDSFVDAIETHRLTDAAVLTSVLVQDDFAPLAARVHLDVTGPAGIAYFDGGQVQVRDVGLSLRAQVPIANGVNEIAVADLLPNPGRELLVLDGGRRLVAFDAQGLGAGAAPQAVWSHKVRGTWLEIADVVVGGDLEVILRGPEGAVDPRIEVWRADDTLVGTVGFTDYASAPLDVVVGDLNGAGNRDLVVLIDDRRLPGDVRRRLVGIDGDTFTELWNVAISSSLTLMPYMADILPPPGVDDVAAFGAFGMGLFRGTDGSVPEDCSLHTVAADCLAGTECSWDGASCLGYTITESSVRHAMWADLDDDGAEEVVVGARSGLAGFDVANQLNATMFLVPSRYGTEFYPNGPCLARVGGQSVVIAANALGELAAWSVPSGDLLWRKYLLDGVVSTYPFQRRIALNRPVAGEIDGQAGDEVLVGSDDGFLYAVDAATGAMRWSLPFEGAPRFPAIADIDNDGSLEVLVAVDDGFVYAIDQEGVGGTAVRDLALTDTGDSVAGAGDTGLSEWTDRAGVGWDPIEGVDSYLVWVETILGERVSDPVVTLGTSVIVPTNQLNVGGTYVSVVQSSDPSGGVPESRSDGFVVADLSGPRLVFTVSADELGEGDTVTLIGELFDPTGLLDYRIDVSLTSGAVLRSWGAALEGQTFSFSIAWRGDDAAGQPLEPGAYHLDLTVHDGHGREATARRVVSVARGPDEAGGSGGAGGTPRQGCACSAQKALTWPWLMLALVPARWGRRRYQRNHPRQH